MSEQKFHTFIPHYQRPTQPKKTKVSCLFGLHHYGPWHDHSWVYQDYRECLDCEHTQWAYCDNDLTCRSLAVNPKYRGNRHD